MIKRIKENLKKNMFIKFFYAYYQSKGISLIKSIYYSIKYKCYILSSFNSTIVVEKNGNLCIDKKGFFNIGYKGHYFGKKTIIRVRENSNLIIGKNVSVHNGCTVFVASGGILSIGDNSYINEDSKIICCNNIKIGNDCAISWFVTILDTDAHKLLKVNNDNILTESVASKPILIGNHVWIGCSVTILKGSIIGNFSVIGANSLINSNIPPNSLSVGNKNKIISNNINWE
jgi:acetyltransferase-like isoleucine patch superfamily enzyme